MADDTVIRGVRRWAGEDVFLDLGAVVMAVAVKVVQMAGSAGAAKAAVDSGVAMAVGAIDAGAVLGGMTESACVVMHCADRIASVAGDAKRGGENRGRVAVGVAGEIFGVAGGASAFCNHGDVIFVDRIRQLRGVGVTEAAVVLMHRHRVVGRVAGPDAGRGVGDEA